MKVANIRIPPPRRRSTWQIQPDPQATSAAEHALMGDFTAYTKMLVAAGFKREMVASIPPGIYHKPPMPLDEFGLWLHPAGIIAKVRSYTSGVRSGRAEDANSFKKQVGSIIFITHMECGTGPEAQHRAAVTLSGIGSGFSDRALDGRDVRVISYVAHQNAGTLHDFTTRCQPYARFLPLAQWDLETAPVLIGIPPEISLSTDPQRAAAFANSIKSLPRDLAVVIESGSATTSRTREWTRLESGLGYFSQALSLAGKYWRSSFDSDLLCHWSHVALGNKGDDPEYWRAFEVGSANLSLPTIMLYAHPTPLSNLLRLLESAPLPVLERWAIKPDAAGFTLALHAMNLTLLDSNANPRQDDVSSKILECLHSRLGKRGLLMATARCSVLGLPIQTTVRPSTAAIGRFVAGLNLLESWGVQWDQHLRWRTHYNLFKDKDRPAFFSVDGQITPEIWIAQANIAGLSQCDPIVARLCAKRLASRNHATPAKPVKRTRRA